MLDRNLNTPLAFHYIFTTESLLIYKLTDLKIKKIRMAQAHANTYNFTFKFLYLSLLFKVQPI